MTDPKLNLILAPMGFESRGPVAPGSTVQLHSTTLVDFLPRQLVVASEGFAVWKVEGGGDVAALGHGEGHTYPVHMRKVRAGARVLLTVHNAAKSESVFRGALIGLIASKDGPKVVSTCSPPVTFATKSVYPDFVCLGCGRRSTRKNAATVTMAAAPQGFHGEVPYCRPQCAELRDGRAVVLFSCTADATDAEHRQLRVQLPRAMRPTEFAVLTPHAVYSLTLAGVQLLSDVEGPAVFRHIEGRATPEGRWADLRVKVPRGQPFRGLLLGNAIPAEGDK